MRVRLCVSGVGINLFLELLDMMSIVFDKL